jgi:hypothetical protein
MIKALEQDYRLSSSTIPAAMVLLVSRLDCKHFFTQGADLDFGLILTDFVIFNFSV